MSQKLFRIDDIGASIKYYNQHGKKIFRIKGVPFFYFPWADWWFLKRIWPIKAWAKYDELTAGELSQMVEIFVQSDIIPIFAITAAWVEENNTLVPYPEKFPLAAMVVKEAFLRQKIIIANHGLTHCVPGKHLPTFWGNDRKFYREFWPEFSQSWHNEHIFQSQGILEDWLTRSVNIFVPPGNVWSVKTYLALQPTNINLVVANRYMIDSQEEMERIKFHNDADDFNYHDRELKLFGRPWLIEKINKYKKYD